MRRRFKKDFSLVALSLVILMSLIAADFILRRNTANLMKEPVLPGGRSIGTGWDKAFYSQIQKMFLPKWKEDILDLRVAIEKRQDDSRLVIDSSLRIAEIFKQHKKYKDAEKTCKKILESYGAHPLRKEVYKKLSSIYTLQKKFSDAKRINQLLIEEFPDDSG